MEGEGAEAALEQLAELVRNGFGEGSSPTVHGDVILVPWDHEGPSALHCLDARTGRELWHFDPAEARPGRAGGGALGVNRGLVFWREGRERRILFNAGFFIHALDPDTGRPIESFGEGGRIDLREGLDRDVRNLDF